MTTPFGWAVRCSVFLLFECVCTPVALGGADPIRTVTLPESGSDFAIHPETGALAILHVGIPSVLIYPKFAAGGSLAEPVHVDVANSPTGIAFKRLRNRDVFAVTCSPANELAVVDAKTFQLLKSIPLQLTGSRSVAASTNPADPYVYYCGEKENNSSVSRVDLETLVDEGPINTGDSVSDVAISHDGRILYTRARSSSGTFRAVEIISPLPAKPALAIRPLHSENRESVGYLPEPTGQFVGSGTAIYTADLSRQVARFDGRVALFFDHRPLLATISDKGLTFFSTNTFKQLSAVAISSETTAPTRPGANRPIDPRGRVDARRFLEGPGGRSLVVCDGKIIRVIDVEELKLPSEPFLAVTVQGDMTFVVGQPAVVKLIPRQGSPRIELREPRERQTISTYDLRWQPGDGDVGPQEVGIRLSLNGLVVDRTLRFTVRRPSIDIGFRANDLAISPDGRSALVWEHGLPRNRDQSKASRIALLDLDRQTVVAERSMPNGVTIAAVDRHFAYVATLGTNVFYALDRKNLSDARRMFTDSSNFALVPVADRLLFVVPRDGGPMVAFRLPELEPASTTEIGSGIHSRLHGQEAGAPKHFGDRWWYDGCLYDESLSRLLALSRPRAFAALDLSGPRLERESRGERTNSPAAMAFSMGTEQTGAGMSGDRRWGSTPQAGLLPGLPAYAVVTFSGQPMARPSQIQKSELVIYDLMEQNPVAKLILRVEQADRGPAQFPDSSFRVEFHGTVVTTLLSDKVYCIDLSKTAVGRLTAPAHCEPQWPIVCISGANQTIPPPVLRGMTEPIEWSLEAEVPGVTIDAKTGVLTVSASELEHHLATALSDRLAQQIAQLAGGPRSKYGDKIKTYAAGIADRFERLVGRKATNVPIWMSIGVSARDKNGQRIEADPGMFVEVAQDKLIALRPRRPNDPNIALDPAAEPDAAASPETIATLQRRIDQLERKVEQLTAKIDLLTQLLRDKPTPAKPPEK